MHRSETTDLVVCLDCKAEVSLGADRVFLVTEDTALCPVCALKRGGTYDAVHDTWTRAPDLTGVDASRREW